jgi:fumarylacetoacetase
MLDNTHSPQLTSWVATANGHRDFPIQNLPFGVFSPIAGSRRIGVAIGDSILDIPAARRLGLFQGRALLAADACQGSSLNELMATSQELRLALRHALSGILKLGSSAEQAIGDSGTPLLYDSSVCQMHLPAHVGGYTDFFAGIHHAVRAGQLLRANSPLPANYKYVPIAYNGRASTVGVAPASVRRPHGQSLPEGRSTPIVAPSDKLDYELELAIWIGQGNPEGDAIPIEQAGKCIFGFGLFNDWSARDIQRWEAQPLGPFLGKSFASTVSPWLVTVEALEPFRVNQTPRPPGDPRPLNYLYDEADQARGAMNIDLEVQLRTSQMKSSHLPPEPISKTNASELYWTVAQLIAHHTVNGCVLGPGDLCGSGTISGDGIESAGCLLERTADGKNPLRLRSGEERQYLQDGDEIIFRGCCRREGFISIGFGENRGTIFPSR